MGDTHMAEACREIDTQTIDADTRLLHYYTGYTRPDLELLLPNRLSAPRALPATGASATCACDYDWIGVSIGVGQTSTPGRAAADHGHGGHQSAGAVHCCS